MTKAREGERTEEPRLEGRSHRRRERALVGEGALRYARARKIFRSRLLSYEIMDIYHAKSLLPNTLGFSDFND